MVQGEHAALNHNQLLLDAATHALALPERIGGRRLGLFYGDLHNHTGYSDGRGRPEEALRQMRERGLHFAAITDHGEHLDRVTSVPDPHKWAALAEQVAALTTEDFLAIRGFEWSSPREGHSNVWWSAAYTNYFETGDASMEEYYRWLERAVPAAGAQVLAGFNHPGREIAFFDGCSYAPALDDRIVTFECFNRGDDYGDTYFRALDRGWHVGAIGVSDHHESDWGSPRLPRAGLLASALTLEGVQEALRNRSVFATRSPSLALLIAGNGSSMGARLALPSNEQLELGVWCNDPEANRDWTRLELYTNGGMLVEAKETRGLQQLGWRVDARPQTGIENWYIARVQRHGMPVAYSSPIWVSDIRRQTSDASSRQEQVTLR